MFIVGMPATQCQTDGGSFLSSFLAALGSTSGLTSTATATGRLLGFLEKDGQETTCKSGTERKGSRSDHLFGALARSETRGGERILFLLILQAELQLGEVAQTFSLSVGHKR